MPYSVAVRLAESPAKPDSVAQKIVQCQGNTFVTCIRLVDGRVDKAWSTGRMMRDINMLLQRKNDRQGRLCFAPKAHCLCNDGHTLAAIRAVENSADVVLPESAILVRELIQDIRFIQTHLQHFYQFHLSDWVNLKAALRADPVKTARMTSVWGENATHFRSVQDNLRPLADKELKSVHSYGEYSGREELHLLLHGHAFSSVQAGFSLQKALKLLGCTPKEFKAYHIGGLPADLNLNAATVEELRAHLEECRAFICKTFPSDLARLAKAYPHLVSLGKNTSFMAYANETTCKLKISKDQTAPWELSRYENPVVREECEPQWNDMDRRNYRLSAKQDRPLFSWNAPRSFWLPAPRHKNLACEVGPLARVLCDLSAEQSVMQQTFLRVSCDCGISIKDMTSMMGRVLSRGIESSALMDSICSSVDKLESLVTTENRHHVDFSLPAEGTGIGRVDVPRGILTHTVHWDRKQITKHEYLIPSLWNFSPRDSRGEPGPLEHALMGTPVSNPEYPVEILRTLHELDPCNTCYVLIEDHNTGLTTVTAA
ncbi:nickel-dependent hydrogenase large subunit [Maridesulfovibrio sp.]|uniref:nickel-dependent hydrogenase large subunit n=1 Tax=Maridesulfovibrio sp. TaxID=2795000 RepID=UPI002A18A480|nr:nickel-dependent hydrogenase large subunit [Maridesulfovibrio sp.]